MKNWTARVASVMALVCGFAPSALAQFGDPPSSLSLPISDMIWVWPGPFGDYNDAASVNCGTCYQTYRFMPDVTGSYTISTGGSLDSMLRVYNSSGTAITSVIDTHTDGESVTLTCTAGQWYFVAVAGYSAAIGDFTLAIQGPVLLTTTVATPEPAATGSVSGSLAYGGKQFYFKVIVPTGRNKLTVHVTPQSGLDTYCELYNGSGNYVTNFDNGYAGGSDDLVSFSVTAGSTYYVGVSGNSVTQTGSYTVAVDFDPDVTSHAPTLDPISSQTVPLGQTLTLTRLLHQRHRLASFRLGRGSCSASRRG